MRRMNWFLIGLGGAIGAMLRYASVLAGARLFGTALPYGVFFSNVAGSFLMGLAAAVLLERLAAPRAALFLLPGILGGFTTFSAYSLDAVLLFEEGRAAAAALYVVGSVVLALFALCCGLWLGRSFG